MGRAAKISKRVGMISLGCAKNLVDSEIILGQLGQEGYEVTSQLEEADTVIVNTCGFIDEAKEESVNTILEVVQAKSAGTVKKLLVAGCMVNRYGEELAGSIPEIDGFIGLDELQKVGEVVRIGGGATSPKPSHMVFDHTAKRLLTTHGHAYLKVAEGCNNPCTFCAIPVWRGQFRSRTLDSLVAEAKSLQAAGVQELCLIAQDTTRYGEDLGLGRDGLQRLVERLLRDTEIPWIRFLYGYPTTLDEGLLALMGAEERFNSYLDMPLQHSHPDILRAMKRGGSARRYHQIIDRARELVPDLFLRSTFICGFPGEEEEHFEDLLSFVRQVRFDHLGGFVFSPEEDTPSAQLPGRVPRTTARLRHERLLEEQEPIALAQRQRLVGRVLRVLVEGVSPETDHLLEGRHAGMAPSIDGRILINDGEAPAATFAEVEITEAYADDLVGRIVGPVGAPGVVRATSADFADEVSSLGVDG